MIPLCIYNTLGWPITKLLFLSVIIPYLFFNLPLFYKFSFAFPPFPFPFPIPLISPSLIIALSCIITGKATMFRILFQLQCTYCTLHRILFLKIFLTILTYLIIMESLYSPFKVNNVGRFEFTSKLKVIYIGI